jgi:predicted trehalose synthase
VCAQEFLPGAQDAWQLALDAAGTGVAFTTEAHAIGVITAQIHATLASAMATRATQLEDVESILKRMHGRLTAAVAEVPELSRFADGLAQIFERASHAEWPAQQRVHGDLHLGQVLAVPGRGWVVVDFEGEPLRPMSERVLLDSPMRDVAGMLRSFDYAGGSVAIAQSTRHPRDWVAATRDAFIAGYSEAAHADILVNAALIDAFEVDKALYETVYEARNRPAWLPIPVAAIERLAARFVD